MYKVDDFGTIPVGLRIGTPYVMHVFTESQNKRFHLWYLTLSVQYFDIWLTYKNEFHNKLNLN